MDQTVFIFVSTFTERFTIRLHKRLLFTMTEIASNQIDKPGIRDRCEHGQFESESSLSQ
jgi:hypothetical protein